MRTAAKRISVRMVNRIIPAMMGRSTIMRMMEMKRKRNRPIRIPKKVTWLSLTMAKSFLLQVT
jgi:hypothetical protein